MSQQKSFLTAEGLKYATEVEGREGRQLIKIEHNRQNVVSIKLSEDFSVITKCMLHEIKKPVL